MRPLVLPLALLVTLATPAAAADPFDRYRAIAASRKTVDPRGAGA